jgi:putative transposase
MLGGLAGWHVASGLVIPRNITLVQLPSYSPELNPVENVWKYLRKNKLALRGHQTYDAIANACCHAWNDFMATPNRIASVTARQWAVVS